MCRSNSWHHRRSAWIRPDQNGMQSSLAPANRRGSEPDPYSLKLRCWPVSLVSGTGSCTDLLSATSGASPPVRIYDNRGLTVALAWIFRFSRAAAILRSRSATSAGDEFDSVSDLPLTAAGGACAGEGRTISV